MSQKVREEMLPRLRQRYVNRGRQGRSRMIDELCEQFGYSRKHAIKLLGARTGWGGDPAVRKGRPPEYGEEVVEVLWRIWKVSEQPCGKRLVEMLGLWLPHYEAEHGKLSAKDRHGARVKRRHDRPMPPCDRLLQSDGVSLWKKAELRATRKALNPFELRRRLEAALRPLLLRALHSSRPTGSLHCEPAAATLPA